MSYRLYLGPIDGDPKNIKALIHSLDTLIDPNNPRPRTTLASSLYGSLISPSASIQSATCPVPPPCDQCCPIPGTQYDPITGACGYFYLIWSSFYDCDCEGWTVLGDQFPRFISLDDPGIDQFLATTNSWMSVPDPYDSYMRMLNQPLVDPDAEPQEPAPPAAAPANVCGAWCEVDSCTIPGTNIVQWFLQGGCAREGKLIDWINWVESKSSDPLHREEIAALAPYQDWKVCGPQVFPCVDKIGFQRQRPELVCNPQTPPCPTPPPPSYITAQRIFDIP